jgi:GT2 family glycosyltransferase/glycosyltransferase involved in cell wall biosynthesis
MAKRSVGKSPKPAGSPIAAQLRPIFDAAFYVKEYPDLASTRLDPLEHYALHGLNEGRNPNPFFDGAWYREHNPDVAASGMDPLLHYLSTGAAELRNPHPRFDAVFYAEHHPQAAANPLVFHMLVGRGLGFATEPAFDEAAFLPSREPVPSCPAGVSVDVVIPCYRGLAETRRCVASVLADPDRPPGRIIVVDDASPEPALSAWLARHARDGRITLLRNARNLGFVASVNRAVAWAGRADVALLNSDTVVPAGWLSRLAGHAYAEERVASVSPWSNNATICSYPTVAGGLPAFGLAADAIDAAARAANAGRRVRVPTTVGFCMYIRRAALDEVGAFDAEAFGRGYGEECDFCLRAAARGWRHMLACDTYVHHEAEVSFGRSANRARAAGEVALAARWPEFPRMVERHVLRGPAEPARFALTAELYRRAGLPMILFVSHSLGGGVRRHVEILAGRLRGRANVLLLQPSERGALVSAPSLPGHGAAAIPADRTDALIRVLASAGVSRVHVHHVMGLDVDLRRLIRGLGVPFDVTVHDWFLVCPQVNLLPHLDGQYCGEPDQAGCNACIANRPSHGAREILHWRASHAWLLREAERVLCPSEDARQRVARFGWGAKTVLAPHEPAMAEPWTVRAPPLRSGEALRVVVLGVLAAQKGEASVRALAEATDAAEIELRLIGYPERELPRHLQRRIKASGPYEKGALPGLLAKARAHVAWFPAQWPETWSYTLSAAIVAGLPIVAARIGAFPERLAGRPLTWLVEPDASAAVWRAAFAQARAAIGAGESALSGLRPALGDFYGDEYLTGGVGHSPLPLARGGRAEGFAGSHAIDVPDSLSRTDRCASPPPPCPLPQGEGEFRAGPRDVRDTSLSIIVVPERYDTTGVPTPCAYIRLLQPLHHPLAAGVRVTVARPEEALDLRADILLTQRHAIPDLEGVEALARHCEASGMAFVYDLDDDLLHLPPDHAEAARLRERMAVVRRLLARADAVWVSTPGLARAVEDVRRDARVVSNGLDERLWFPDGHAPRRLRQGPVRVLFMGTATHDGDFALVEPALARLHARFGPRVQFDMIGVTARGDVPAWVNRVAPEGVAGQSYPGFVDWITQLPAWDIGIAPLADTPFNRAKSAIKTLDYAALGAAVLASDVPAYRGSLAEAGGGRLVANTEAAWAEALDHLVRHARLRRDLAAHARAMLLRGGTLAAQASARLAALHAAAGRAGQVAVPRLQTA